MYEYTVRLRSPHTVEFLARTVSGHRIVMIYLDLPTPRFKAWNETRSEQLPALLWKDELDCLIRRAKEVCKIS